MPRIYRRRRPRRRFARRAIRSIHRRITRVARMGSQIVWLRRQITPVHLTAMTTNFGQTSQFYQYHPHTMTALTETFGTAATDMDSNSLRHRHTTIKLSIDACKVGFAAGVLIQFIKLRPQAV